MSTETFISNKHIENAPKSEGWGGLSFIGIERVVFVSQGDGGSAS